MSHARQVKRARRIAGKLLKQLTGKGNSNEHPREGDVRVVMEFERLLRQSCRRTEHRI